MKFLKYIVPLLLVFQIAVFAKNFVENNATDAVRKNCKTVGKDLKISVCVEKTTEDAKLTNRLVKALKAAVRDLVKDYQFTTAELNNPIPVTGPGTTSDYCDTYYPGDACCIDEVTYISCAGPNDHILYPECCG